MRIKTVPVHFRFGDCNCIFEIMGIMMLSGGVGKQHKGFDQIAVIDLASSVSVADSYRPCFNQVISGNPSSTS